MDAITFWGNVALELNKKDHSKASELREQQGPVSHPVPWLSLLPLFMMPSRRVASFLAGTSSGPRHMSAHARSGAQRVAGRLISACCVSIRRRPAFWKANTRLSSPPSERWRMVPPMTNSSRGLLSATVPRIPSCAPEPGTGRRRRTRGITHRRPCPVLIFPIRCILTKAFMEPNGVRWSRSSSRP